MSKQYSILYVDDEPDNLTAFRILFRRQYNIYITDNVNEAIDLIETHSIDLVLSDYKMPKKTGIQLLEEVEVKFPDIVRFIVTGYGDLNIIKNAIGEGTIKGVIHKPWNITELKSLLQSSLAAI